MQAQFLQFSRFVILVTLPFLTTAQSLKLIKEIVPGRPGSYPIFQGESGFFLAGGSIYGGEPENLYFTDGTSAGTKLIQNKVHVFPDASGIPAQIDKSLYFAPISKPGLFRVDVGANTMSALNDTVNAYGNGVRTTNNIFYFMGNGLLWKSDGTKAGTVSLKTDAKGFRSPLALGEKVFFVGYEEATGYELWTTDGTPQGTKLVKDIVPDKGSSLNSSGDPPYLTILNNKLLFLVTDDGSGRARLWTSDGTAAGTVPLTSKISTNISKIVGISAKDNTLYFTVKLSTGSELWRTDGTDQGTSKVDIGVQTNAESITYLLTSDGFFFNVFKGRVASGDSGSVQRIADGQVTKMFSFTTGYPGPTLLGSVDGALYISARVGSNTDLIIRCDGTGPGTYIVENVSHPFEAALQPLFRITGKTYFALKHAYYNNDPNGGGVSFTRLDQQNGKEILVEIFIRSPYLRFDANNRIVLNNRLISSAYQDGDLNNYELWTFDPGAVPVQSCNLTASVSGNTSLSCISNATTSLTVSTGGGIAPFAYQWQRNGTIISGAISATYATNATGDYTVIVTDSKSCSVISSKLTLTGFESVSISITGSTALCVGQSTTLNASITNGTAPYTYQWKQNGTSIGTNTASITITTGGTYSLTITDGCSTTSASVVVSSVAPPANVTATNTGPYDTGQTIQLNASGGNTYAWKGPGGFIASTSNPTISKAMTANAGSYTVIVGTSSACPTSLANTIVVIRATVQPPTITASRLAVCAGASITLTAQGCTGTIRWSSGQTGSSITTQPTTPTTYTAICDVDGRSSPASNAITVNIAAAPATPTITASSLQIVGGSTITLTTGVGTIGLLQWLQGNSPITGASSRTYITTQAGDYSLQVTNAGGCTAVSTTITINLITNTGPLYSLTESQIMVYPNSTTGDCWVMIDVAYKQAINLQLVDALGKSLRQWYVSATPKMQPIRVSLPDVNGWYFLRVETEKGSVVKKVLRIN